ncbi:MAG: NAD(P)/FAD-dependent oxidoreductase [Candidatus Micrarchaeaceae archaeon]
MKAIVIGAGVIGLHLAERLALSGISVKVYDRKQHITDGAEKASGILSISGLNASGLPYRSAVLNTLDGALLYAGRQKLYVESKEPKAYVIDRAKLALNAYHAAVKAGAEIILEKGIGAEELHALARSGKYVIIGADGAVSATASAFSFPPIKEYALTYKEVYKGARITDASKVELVFSRATPGFFGWTVPYKKNVLEIGAGVSSRAKMSSYQAFKGFSSSAIVYRHIKPAERLNGYASIIPLAARSTTVKGDIALVGDAAGQVKATTGGGIIFGTACADALSTAIEKRIREGKSLKHYEKEWRKRYGTELKLHSLAHAYYSSLGEKGLEALFRLSKIFGIEGFLGKHGDMDRPSIIIRRFFLRH